nr:hypothetical protein [uncultured Blautia sp.]
MIGIEERITIKQLCEITEAIKRKVEEINRTDEEERIYEDIHKQALREANEYNLESINQVYFNPVIMAILNYKLPAYLDGAINGKSSE